MVFCGLRSSLGVRSSAVVIDHLFGYLCQERFIQPDLTAETAPALADDHATYIIAPCVAGDDAIGYQK